MSEDFDWGELGSDWWLTTSREIGANTKQAMFACAKHRGASNTEAARQSGYGSGSEAAVRAEGYRVFRSNTVQQLLSLAVAEAGGGYGGDITDAEARQILAKLARGSDPQVKIKALESLAKMDAVKAAAEREEGTRSPAAIIAELKLNAPFRALELGTLMGLPLPDDAKQVLQNHNCKECAARLAATLGIDLGQSSGNGHAHAHT